MSKLLLIDGHSILNRAFFGLPDLTNSAGEHTGAIFGFLNMMLKFIETEQPDNLMVAFDLSAPTFRHKMFEGYKGTRKPMAPELKEQVPRMQEMLKAMGVTVVTLEGYEADDILGTLSRQAEEAGYDVTIVSGDRDLLQLATTRVKISIPKTKKTGTEIENYYELDVEALYGVNPRQFIDVKALMGDASDNIPGVSGIGEKTASALISQYGSIEGCHDHVSELKPPRAAKNLEAEWDIAVMSKALATINVHAPLEFDEAASLLSNLFTEEAYVLAKRYELKKILPRFEATDTTKVVANTADSFKRLTDLDQVKDFFLKLKSTAKAIDTQDADSTISQAAQAYVGLDIVAKDTDEIVGLAISIGDESVYIPVAGHIDASFLIQQLSELSEAGCCLVLWDMKKAMHLIYSHMSDSQRDLVLKEGGKEAIFPHACDLAVAAYLLNPTKNDYTADDIAAEKMDMIIPSKADLFGKKKLKDIISDESMQDALATFASYNAYVAAAAFPKLLSQVEKEGMLDIYETMELPLVYTLFDMEIAGIAMDSSKLLQFGDSLKDRISQLEKCIYEKAGETFNINSPKQLSSILFEKMKIKGGKKTKTGYSTAADVLEALAADNPIVTDILEYRQLTKLMSTYVEGLSAAVSEDGRVHSTFMQTVTATGRISSTEPNLQNIPVRMELGRQIRQVFYPREGYVFLDADYSQIELRVLAHMSGDEKLIEAFNAGQDIHRSTASLVFNTPFDQVTDLQRRNAKAVNFGIVYGISAFGLAKDIGIGNKEAQGYIDDYFEAYPRMHEFLEGLKTFAKEKGYAITMFGRRRPIAELKSSNFMTRAFGERVAMNSPIQGTAADIIKLAMVRVHDRLLNEGLKSKLILQVHDELLIETALDEQDKVQAILQEEMEHAADLAVKLEIDMNSGASWAEAH